MLTRRKTLGASAAILSLSLAPGDNIFPSVPLPNPYPPERVLLLQASAAILDAETGLPVPQDVLYLHQ